MAPRFRLNARLGDQRLQRFVVRHLAVAQQSVLTVGRVGVQRDVADDADVGDSADERAHGAADEIIGVGGFLSVRRFAALRRDGEDGDRRNAEIARPRRRLHEAGDGMAADAGHRRNGSGRVVLVDKDGPDQIVHRQAGFRDQPPRPRVAPVAARADGRKPPGVVWQSCAAHGPPPG